RLRYTIISSYPSQVFYIFSIFLFNQSIILLNSLYLLLINSYIDLEHNYMALRQLHPLFSSLTLFPTLLYLYSLMLILKLICNNFSNVFITYIIESLFKCTFEKVTFF